YVGKGLPSHQEEQRVLDESDDDCAVFTFFPVFLPHDARVMTRRNVKAESIFIVNLDTINTNVDPAAFFRLGGNDAVCGADVAAAVQFMPLGRGENGHGDVRAGADVVEDR